MMTMRANALIQSTSYSRRVFLMCAHTCGRHRLLRCQEITKSHRSRARSVYARKTPPSYIGRTKVFHHSKATTAEDPRRLRSSSPRHDAPAHSNVCDHNAAKRTHHLLLYIATSYIEPLGNALLAGFRPKDKDAVLHHNNSLYTHTLDAMPSLVGQNEQCIASPWRTNEQANQWQRCVRCMMLARPQPKTFRHRAHII